MLSLMTVAYPIKVRTILEFNSIMTCHKVGDVIHACVENFTKKEADVWSFQDCISEICLPATYEITNWYVEKGSHNAESD